MSCSKVVVAVDIDEVLAKFLDALISYHNDTFGSSLALQDFHSYLFKDVWGGTYEEGQKKVEDFLQSPYFQSGLSTISGARESLEILRTKFDLVVVTSRQTHLEEHTRQWLDSNFPGIFSIVEFGNHFGDGVRRTKYEICKELGATVLIDDSPKYCNECSQHGILAILFDLEHQYGWSKAETLPEVRRVSSWPEVEQILMSL